MHNTRDMVAHFPREIRIAFEQSGVLDDGRNLDWAQDPLIQVALMGADEAHGGKLRKNDDRTRLIHEVWLAHEAHNDKALSHWLQDNGLDPRLGVLGVILHDRVENMRDRAEEKGEKFLVENVLSAIGEFAVDEDPHDLKNKRALFSFMRFMTDKPGFSKAERYRQQLLKTYNKYGLLIANPLEQTGRLLDKMSHVVLDAQTCSPDQPQKALAAWMQAMAKIFALDVPVATEKHLKSYLAASDKLLATAEMNGPRKRAARQMILTEIFTGQPELLYCYNRIMSWAGRQEEILTPPPANDPGPNPGQMQSSKAEEPLPPGETPKKPRFGDSLQFG